METCHPWRPLRAPHSGPGQNYEGMFQLYNANRQQGIGNYITVDFILTAYNLLVQELLTIEEEEVYIPPFAP